MRLYAVQMNESGKPSYILGVYSTLELACDALSAERYRRGNAVDGEIFECLLDAPVIVEGMGT